MTVPMTSHTTVNPCDVVMLSETNRTQAVFPDINTLNLSSSPQYLPKSISPAASFN